MSLGINEGKPGTVTEAIEPPLVGVIVVVGVEADLPGVEFLGALGALGAFSLGAFGAIGLFLPATRLAAFFPALALVASRKLGIVQKLPCIQEGRVNDLQFIEFSVYRVKFSL